MIIISNIVQPISCITFNIAGMYEPWIPNEGLILMRDGTALSLPILPARAKRKEPVTEPMMIANIASANLAELRKDPAEKTKRPTPRLDQSIKYSVPRINLYFNGTGSIPH